MKFFHGRHNQCLPEFFEIQADLRSLYANRRNLITIFAIALTTLLFTSMFTIVLSLNASYETYQFRQVGGYAHGTFKAIPHNANSRKKWYNIGMDKQLSLSALSDVLSQVRTKKREFLDEIERIVPWEKWVSIIKPYYYKGERGNKPYDLERMLRIYLVQNPYNLSDMATVAEVIDSRAFSDFYGVESSNQVPDGDTLGRFRNILMRNGIQQELFAQVVELLMQRGLILKRGAIVDSTFIEAPSSTKNEKKERDPEAHSAKKAMYGTLAIKPISE